MLPVLLALLCAGRWVMVVEGGEPCGGGVSVGDKWFDGCHWCVCTSRGPRCSSSSCSSLVQKVASCHVVGQKWTDGCYQCRCQRQGITCRLDVTCRLLRHHPMPCLADERCVCGPDGVPSCTAEVIDRNAFTARRVDLSIPLPVNRKLRHPDSYRRLRQTPGKAYSDSQHGSHDNSPGEATWHRFYDDQIRDDNVDRQEPLQMLQDQPHVDTSSDHTSQELLITSDNLCRLGARWYGGSLRCFCDLEGAVTCGNPTFVSAFFDDFRVGRQRCEEGHAWEEDCKVCTCHLNGVIFCRHNHNCRQVLGNDDDDDDDVDDDDDDDDTEGIDHYLPGVSDHQTDSSSVDDTLSPPTFLAYRKGGSGPPPGGCVPGWRWREGCLRCHCSRQHRPICSPRHCGRKSQGEDDLHSLDPLTSSNDAKDVDVTLGPSVNRSPRGPMMVVPKPVSVFQPPAYSKPPARPINTRRCGRFRVGAKYWDDCNLCLCTNRGPRCQGKLCR